MRIFRYIFFTLLLAGAGWAQTQEDNANANVVFSQAIQLYVSSQNFDEAKKKQAAIEVLRLFDLISTAYPDSIPGQRLKADSQVGPIDLPALRALAGVDAVEENTEPPKQEDVPETVAIEVPEVLEWYQKILYSGSLEGGFGHGEFPSIGQRTHPGVDIFSACGVEITVPVDATVVKVVKAGDPAFPQTGNAIVLRYQSIYLAYFFLGATPLVREGDVAEGQAIGTTGPLHGLDTCGTHFEVRLFEADDTLTMPLWHDVLAVGNWRNDPAFNTAWRNPEDWLIRLDREGNSSPLLLAQKGPISVYYSRFLGAYNQPRRLFHRGANSEQGLTLERSITVSRILKTSLRLELNYLFGTVNSDATENMIRSTDELRFRFRATLVSLDNPDEIVLSRNISVNARFSNGSFRRLSQPSVITFPESALRQADLIKVELVASDGKVFSLGPDILLETIEPEEKDLPSLVTSAEQILIALDACLNMQSAFAGSMTYTFYTLGGAQEKIYNMAWLDYAGSSRLQSREEYRRVRRVLVTCGAIEIAKPVNSNRSSLPLEIVIARPEQ